VALCLAAREEVSPQLHTIDALDLLRTLLEPPIPLTIDFHDTAIAPARDHQFAFYDAHIVRQQAAPTTDVLFTREMQDGKRIGRLTIRNPFFAA